MIKLIVNKGNCKCKGGCTMTKYGLDYFCNRCHKPEFGITDDNFTDDNDYMAEVKAENDAEMMEEMDRQEFDFDRNFEDGLFDKEEKI